MQDKWEGAVSAVFLETMYKKSLLAAEVAAGFELFPQNLYTSLVVMIFRACKLRHSAATGVATG